MKTILLVLVLLASFAYGEETNLTLTVDGVTYRNVRFRGTTPVEASIFHSTGVATIPLEKLPLELQKQLGYDPRTAAQWRADRQAAQQRAASSISRLSEKGAFVFFQKDAHVFCDQPALRFSVWNDDQYLLAQAVLWNDGDSSLGKTEDNRDIGDCSKLMLDLDADKQPTPNVDRDYLLNPWPGEEGLRYAIHLGKDSTTPFRGDSQGRGAIRYVVTSNGKRVRVDTYLIPLPEISKRVGNKIRICYWGFSPKPRLTVNSAGYEAARETYYSYNIPRSRYHEYVLTKGGKIDTDKVPDGRDDVSPSK